MTTAILLLDTAMNAGMLALAARLRGSRIRAVRLMASALCGAMMAWAVRRIGLSRLQAAALWLPAASIMMRMACGRGETKHPIRAGLLLLCAAGLEGGMVLAISGAIGSLQMAYAAGGAAMLAIIWRAARVEREVRTDRSIRIVCRYRGEAATFDAVIDSGNTLRDYLTRLPVIVIPEEAGTQRLQLEGKPLRPIFADTAGGRQMMGAFMPQALYLETKDGRKPVCAVVALSPGMRREAPALVPAHLAEMQAAEEV